MMCFVCVLLGILMKFSLNPYYEPLSRFMIWLEVRSRLVKKRLWLTKTIVTSFSFVGIKHDNF